MEHGIRVRQLAGRIDLVVVFVHLDPGLHVREARVGAVVPLHGGAGVVNICNILDGYHKRAFLGAPAVLLAILL